VPEYFEGDCTMHSCETYAVLCFCCGRDNPSQVEATALHKEWSMFIF